MKTFKRPEIVVTACLQYYKFDFRVKGATQEYSEAREMCGYMMKMNTTLTDARICKYLNVSRSLVTKYTNAITDALKNDDRIRFDYDEIMKILG